MGSISSACNTQGVIHPPHTLFRGNMALSRITTRNPEARKAQAHDDPAGPPPTIKTSHECIALPVSPVQMHFCKGDRASTAVTCRLVRQKQFGTTAECPSENRRSIQPDISATSGQKPGQSG